MSKSNADSEDWMEVAGVRVSGSGTSSQVCPPLLQLSTRN
jgi:hypothetical protein